MIKTNMQTEFPAVKMSSRRVEAVWEGFVQTRDEKPKEITVLPRMLPVDFPLSLEKQVFVATNGCDEKGDGTKEKPFATVARALAVAGDQGAVIWLRGGVYAPFELSAENSGLSNAPLFISAYEDEEVTFIAGKSFSPEHFVPVDEADFVSADDKALFNKFKAGNSANIYAVDLAKVGFVKEDFADFSSAASSAPVYIGDTAYHVARFPNVGENDPEQKIFNGRVRTMNVAEGAKNVKKIGKPVSPVSRLYRDYQDHEGGWELYIDDTTYADRVTKYRNAYDNLYMFGSVYEEWSNVTNHVRIRTEDGETVMAEAGERNVYGAMPCGSAGLYFYNMPEDLDAENEYIIDLEKMVLYVYGMPNDTVTVSTTKKEIVKVEGASHVVLNGISFKFASSDAVVFHKTKEVFAQACRFRGVDRTCLMVNDCYMSGAIYSTFEDSFLSIKTDFNKRETNPTCNIFQNNVFGNYGSIQGKISGLHLTGGFGDVVSHNKFIECACSVNFQFDLVFEYNELDRGNQYNHDSGVFYTHVSCRGMHIRNNWVHDLNYVTCGIYLDDMSAGNYIYNNIVHFAKVPWWNRCINLHNGQMNVVYNNLCINAGTDGAIVNQASYAPKTINGMVVEAPCGMTELWWMVSHNFISGSYHQMNEEVMRARYPLYAYATAFNDRANAKMDANPDGWDKDNKISPDEDDEIFARMPCLNVYKNNVVYASYKGLSVAPFALDTCLVQGNLVYNEKTNLSFKDEKNGNYTLMADSIVFHELPAFECIYQDKAGLTK